MVKKNDGPAVQHLYEYYEPDMDISEICETWGVTPENVEDHATEAARFYEEETGADFETVKSAYSAAFEEYFDSLEE